MIGNAGSIRVPGLAYLHERVCEHHSLLIVDDVYSTGSSVRAVVEQLARKSRRNLPRDIRIATVWYRKTDRTVSPPDYYVRETNDWLVLPYELSGLSLDELRNKPEIQPVLGRLQALLEARGAGA
jgi:hypothetical protein